MSNQYSPEVEAFIAEEEKEQNRFNGPRLNPSFVRLIGKNPKKPNPEEMGKLYIQKYSEADKKYFDKTPFGPAPHQSFSAVILDVTYMAKWKYKEGQRFELRTREFHDWKNEQIELLKITHGEKRSTQSVGTFINTVALKQKYRPIDDATGLQADAPYDWIGLIYAYHPATDSIIKYSIKGSAIFGKEVEKDGKKRREGGYWEYLNGWQKAMPGAKVLKQILTTFGVKEEKDEAGNIIGYQATFDTGPLATPEVMEGVVRNAKLLKAWQDAWKASRAPTTQPEAISDDEELPPIDVYADMKDEAAVMEEELKNIPF